MDRRGFLSSILALAAAPAIVRADSLMRIVPVETEILTCASMEIVIDQMVSRPILIQATEEMLPGATMVMSAWVRHMGGDLTRVEHRFKVPESLARGDRIEAFRVKNGDCIFNFQVEGPIPAPRRPGFSIVIPPESMR